MIYWLEKVVFPSLGWVPSKGKNECSMSDKKLFLFLDQATSHTDYRFINWMQSHHVSMFSCESHITHKNRGPDTHIFSPLTADLRRRVEDWHSLHAGDGAVIRLEDFLLLLVQAYYEKVWSANRELAMRS
jgi:hypothetical protein